jgi:hypothetical protein
MNVLIGGCLNSFVDITTTYFEILETIAMMNPDMINSTKEQASMFEMPL